MSSDDPFKLSLLQKFGNLLLEFGLTPLRLKQLAIGLVVIAGISAAIYFSQSDSDEDSPNLEHPAGEVAQSATVGESPKGVRDRDRQHGEPDQMQLSVQKKVVLDCIRRGNDSSAEKRKLESIAEACIRSGDADLAGRASFTLCQVALYEFILQPTDDNAKAIQETLSKQRSCYLGDTVRSNELIQKLARSSRQRQDNPLVGDCLAHLANILLESEIAEDQTAGSELLEFCDYAKFRLGDLQQRIRFHDPDVEQDIQGAIEQLRAQPEVTRVRWRLIIGACEALVSTSQMARHEQTWTALSEIARTMPDANPLKQEVQNLLERQKKRTATVGTTFDVAGGAFKRNQTMQSLIQGYALVIFCDDSVHCSNEAQLAAQAARKPGRNFKAIIAFKDGTMPDGVDKLPMTAESMLLATRETASKYFEQIPVDFYPEMILINKQGKILRTNLRSGQVLATIAAIEQEKKKAAKMKSGEEDSGEEDSGEEDSGEEDSGEEDSGEEDSGEK